ncbi:hypothetical protein QKC54_gp0985 [Megavirus baoshan]|uniref:Uncharacterized protein n=1 Tax=Megavirus baoshan TaxID=2496520 RepID=A0A3Q8U8C8_9VIRU|nr:hypothetical protein QKC54_gp0985 [Megavirus baoshan]AZL89649.1 hypothetical protein Mb0087 [Megavirus baoshan]
MSKIENMDFLSDKLMTFPKSRRPSRRPSRKSERITKSSKNTKSRVLSEREKAKLISRERKHSQKLSNKRVEKLHNLKITQKMSKRIDPEAINSSLKEDDVVFNPEEEWIFDLDDHIETSEPETTSSDVPCGSGWVCDEWSGGYFLVEFYSTKPGFNPSSSGKWFEDEWDRGYYFQTI